MSDYSDTHARAADLVARYGAPVAFVLGNDTINGDAVQDSGAFKQYLAQGLITAEDQVIFFIPSTIGECPEPGAELSGFGSATLSTKRVFPLAPNGTVIAARVVASR